MSRRRPRPALYTSASEMQWAFVTDAIDAEMRAAFNPFELLMLDTDRSAGGQAHKLWDLIGGQALSAWITERPGTRPSLWWDFDAPRQLPIGDEPDGAGRRFALPEPRKRLGGSGEAHEPIGLLDLRLGLPTTDWSGLDQADQPTFESQAAYLGRLGLFTTGERRRLRQKDFRPEAVADAPMVEA